MPSEQDKTSENPYRRVQLEGTKDGLVAFITSSAIVTETEVSELAKDLISLVQLADRVDMPLILNFRELKRISFPLIGTLVLVHKKLKARGQSLKLREVSPQVVEVFHRLGGGGAGGMALI
jgi:anti-anti-sigma regulatory factor